MGNRGLQQVVAQDRRNVSVVEDAGLLPESRFVPVLLDSPAARQRWLADTVAASRKGDKYVFWHGLEAIWETGSSVLVYQHLPRESEERFIPRIHLRMGWPGGQLGGPRTLLAPDGRRIFLDWIREVRGVDAERASGWSGVMTLPRIISLGEDGELRIEPAPESQVLRMNRRVHGDVSLAADATFTPTDVQGDCLELAVEMLPAGGQQFGIKVRCSPDGSEQTAIFYDATCNALKVDVSQTTPDESIRYPYYRTAKGLDRLPEGDRFVTAQEAPFELGVGEALNLRVFLDRSVLEVFANGRQCITQRIYPSRRDSVGVELFSRGGSTQVRSFEAWTMAPTNG